VFQACLQNNSLSCVLLFNLIIAIAKQNYVLIVLDIFGGNNSQYTWYCMAGLIYFKNIIIHRLYEGRKAEKYIRFVNSYCISYSGINNNNALKKSYSFWKTLEWDQTLFKIILTPKRTLLNIEISRKSSSFSNSCLIRSAVQGIPWHQAERIWLGKYTWLDPGCVVWMWSRWIPFKNYIDLSVIHTPCLVLDS